MKLMTCWKISMTYPFQFASLEDFQEEFKDINQEEQISRLHKMLAPHLLRSMYLDCMPFEFVVISFAFHVMYLRL